MSNFYYNAKADIESNFTFVMVIGGRGIGKTYSSLSYIAENLSEEQKFIYLRRTQTELDLCASEYSNPFKVINTDFERDISIKKKKGFGIIYEKDKLLGYAAALSTFANVRGADFSDVELILFDEFIPENSVKRMKGEADSFLNLYETVNRNRELKGKPPVKCILLSNKTHIANPICEALNLVPILERMEVNGQETYKDRSRSILIRMPKVTELAAEKAKTALYRLSGESRFADQAINNSFAYDSWYNVRKCNVKEFYPLCAIDDIFIYRHKSRSIFYACRSRADCQEYTTNDTLLYFMREYGMILREAFVTGKIYFSEILIKETLKNLLTS